MTPIHCDTDQTLHEALPESSYCGSLVSECGRRKQRVRPGWRLVAEGDTIQLVFAETWLANPALVGQRPSILAES